MKSKFFLGMFITILLCSRLNAQNLDLAFIHWTGKYRSMAGAGIAMITGVAAVDLNPAGLANTSNKSISFSQSVDYYSYNLHRAKDINIIRVDAEFFPLRSRKNLPLKLGYGYIPQQYASNNSVGYGNDNYEYSDTDQNVKHLLSFGTALKFTNFLINLNFEHTFLNWHRNLSSTWYVKDDFSEKMFILSTEIIYNIQ